MVIKDEFEENQALKAKVAALEAENARLNDLAHCGIDADGHPLEWRIMADHHRIGEEQLRIEVAALEARCAGLERERDALIAKEIWSSERRVFDLMVLCGRVVVSEAERDALQARAETAEEALRDLERYTTPLQNQVFPQLVNLPLPEDHPLNVARAILAGHAPATPQADHIADASKKVQAAPSDREKRLEEIVEQASKMYDAIHKFCSDCDGECDNCQFRDVAISGDGYRHKHAALADTTNNDGG